MTVEYPRAVEIARRIKLDHKELPIVVGGAHVNAVGKQALLEGEASSTMPASARANISSASLRRRSRGRRYAGMLGLVSRQSGEIVASPLRPPPADYDALPFPAWDLFRSV